MFEGFDIDGIDFEQLLGSSAPEQRSSAAPRLSPPKESSGPLLQQHSSLEANPRHPAAHGALPWQACASMPGMPSLVYPLPTILGGLPAQPLLPLGHQLSAQQHPEVLRQQQEQEPQQQAQPPEQAPPCHGLPLFVSSQTGTRAQEQQQRCEGLLERYWRFTMMQRQGGQAAVAAAQQQHHLGSAATLTPCPPSPHDHGQLPQGSDAASLQRSIDVAVAAAAAAQQQRQQWQQQPGSMLGSRPRSVPPLALPATHPQQSAGNACASGSAGGKCQPLKRCWSEVAGLQPVVEQSVSGGQLGDWARLVAASLGPAVQPGPPKPSSGGSAALQAAAPADSDLLKSAAAAVPFGQGCKEAEAATTDQQSQVRKRQIIVWAAEVAMCNFCCQVHSREICSMAVRITLS